MPYAAASELLINPKDNEHIALLYDKTEQLYAAVADYINEGLKRGELCVYGTIHFRDERYIEKFSTLITNYAENVDNGNLLIIDLAPFYISALLNDTKPFDDAKKLFEDKVRDRADKNIRFVGDGTGFLFKNRHFGECAAVEQWWQEKQFQGSYVCPFQKSFMNAFPYEIHSKHVITDNHDSIIDISDSSSPSVASIKQALSADVQSDKIVHKANNIIGGGS